jgi:hypothetical protein
VLWQQTELNEVIDLKEADSISIPERRVLRIADEDDHFSKDHYWLADLKENDLLAFFGPYYSHFMNTSFISL